MHTSTRKKRELSMIFCPLDRRDWTGLRSGGSAFSLLPSLRRPPQRLVCRLRRSGRFVPRSATPSRSPVFSLRDGIVGRGRRRFERGRSRTFAKKALEAANAASRQGRCADSEARGAAQRADHANATTAPSKPSSAAPTIPSRMKNTGDLERMADPRTSAPDRRTSAHQPLRGLRSDGRSEKALLPTRRPVKSRRSKDRRSCSALVFRVDCAIAGVSLIACAAP